VHRCSRRCRHDVQELWGSVFPTRARDLSGFSPGSFPRESPLPRLALWREARDALILPARSPTVPRPTLSRDSGGDGGSLLAFGNPQDDETRRSEGGNRDRRQKSDSVNTHPASANLELPFSRMVGRLPRVGVKVCGTGHARDQCDDQDQDAPGKAKTWRNRTCNHWIWTEIQMTNRSGEEEAPQWRSFSDGDA
jgi:hypothetical protein